MAGAVWGHRTLGAGTSSIPSNLRIPRCRRRTSPHLLLGWTDCAVRSHGAACRNSDKGRGEQQRSNATKECSSRQPSFWHPYEHTSTAPSTETRLQLSDPFTSQLRFCVHGRSLDVPYDGTVDVLFVEIHQPLPGLYKSLHPARGSEQHRSPTEHKLGKVRPAGDPETGGARVPKSRLGNWTLVKRWPGSSGAARSSGCTTIHR